MSKHSKINKSNVEDVLALTSLQQGMLFHYLENPESRQYHEQLSVTFTGEIRLELIRQAWAYVLKNNQLLRAVYRWEKLAEPMQVILKNYTPEFRELDLRNYSDMEMQSQLASIRELDMAEGLELSEGPLRVTFCRVAEKRAVIIISNHHILYDGWSNGVILKEFLYAYNAYYQGQEPLAPVKTKFKEFLKWQRGQDKEREKEFWGSYLAQLENSGSFGQKKVNGYEGEFERQKNQVAKLPSALVQALEEYVQREKTSLAALLYSIWGVILQRYENHDDVVFGTAVSGRTGEIAGIEDMVGLFVNTVPLRVRIGSGSTLREMLHHIEKSLREREPFQNTSLVEVKAVASLRGDADLFNSLVVIENYPLEKTITHESVISVEECALVEFTNYPLTLAFTCFEGIELNCGYMENVFDAAFVQRLMGHIEVVAGQFLSDDTLTLGEVEILTVEERRQLLEEFNNTVVPYPDSQSLHRIFQRQVEESPKRIAIRYGEKDWTYGEVNNLANRLARDLRNYCIKSDSIVAVMVERSLEMMVGILAILKAGGAYLPIDPTYPYERMNYILKDSQAVALLTTEKWLGLMDAKVEFSGQVVNLTHYSHSTLDLEEDVAELEEHGSSKDLAYVIYTSGTTGNPKGVMIEHHSVVNRICWMQKMYPIGEADVILQKTTYTFDVSVWELFWWFFQGAAQCLLVSGGEKEPDTILQTVRQYSVTTMHFVPSMLNVFLDYLEGEYPEGGVKASAGLVLRQVFASGEALTCEQVKRFNALFGGEVRLINLYGPTEATVDVSYYECTAATEITTVPIGKPIDNIQLHVVNKDQQLQPIGIAGELCIAGVGVARGYLNKPELTKEKFINDHFQNTGKMYRTGDLVRWLADGNLEYLGRIDHQVKVRGFRIELGEIEHQLLRLTGIKNAVVVVQKDHLGQNYLSAYIVSQQHWVVGELRKELAKVLPDYMIPTDYYEIPEIPVTANGKVNRHALMEMAQNVLRGSDYEAPQTPLQQKIAPLWERLLEVERVGINDNFFELGGHSLKAMSLVNMLHKELDAAVTIKELFAGPTVKELAELVRLRKNHFQSIEQVQKQEYYPVSSVQKRLYVLQQFEEASTVYNIPSVLLVQGWVDKRRLQESIQELIRRHEILRTSFIEMGEEVLQVIHEEVQFTVESVGAVDHGVDTSKFIRVFDLQQAPLFRVVFAELGERESLLFFDMHHIIADGVSLEILLRDFVALYNGQALEPLQIQYKDYAVWQQNFIKSEYIKEQEKYWSEELAGDLPVLNLPYDYERPARQSFAGDRLEFHLDGEMVKALQKLGQETESTLFMTLFAAYSVFLGKYAGDELIYVGSPVAGRSHAELANVFGPFVNTVVLKSRPEREKTFYQLLSEIRGTVVAALECQDYPFEMLVEKLNLPREMSRNPLFDVMFVLQNMSGREKFRTADFTLEPVERKHSVAKFDLTLFVQVGEEGIHCELEYSTRLFRHGTVLKMVEHFRQILSQVASNPALKVREIDMVTPKEREWLLYGFNDTAAEYPGTKTVQELFTEEALKSPERIALLYDGESWTYKELNQRVNQLAHTLRSKGIGSDSLLGIMVQRSPLMLIGILGILKAGGAYLPIDSEYPDERINYMLSDSDTQWLLTERKTYSGKMLEFAGEVLCLDDESLYTGDGTELENVNSPTDLVYVIYTSGSTGRPKGVMVEQRGLVNYLCWANQVYVRLEECSFPLFTSLSFDLTVTSVFVPLISGNKVVIYPEADQGRVLARIVADNLVNVVKLTPAHLTILQSLDVEQTSIRRLIVGGEDLKSEVAAAVVAKFGPELEIYNEYGPTETVVGCMIHRYDRKEDVTGSVPIGKPADNVQIYVLDADGQLVVPGVLGEMYISGDGVARGYLNRPELTADKFLANPFWPGQWMYKTGDLARFLPSGLLEFKGRIDDQVKILGYRIELGEIEKALIKVEQVKEAVVLERKDSKGSRYLCGYLVLQEDMMRDELEEALHKELPVYMIPSGFVFLDRLPLTSNGKIDRKALLALEDEGFSAVQYEEPRTELEIALTAIWQDVLGVRQISVRDNFFKLGGHSLKATLLGLKIRKHFQVDISLKEIFASPTVEGLAKLILAKEKGKFTAIVRISDDLSYPASSAQRRMYTLQQIEPESTGYNTPLVVEFVGGLDGNRIQRAFRELVQRHEILRTSFTVMAGEIRQVVHAEMDFSVQCIHVPQDDLDATGNERLLQMVKGLVRPFDLQQGPLFRVVLICLANERHILFLDLHHSITDGVSLSILLRELIELYSGQMLEPLRVQYRDFASWQNGFLESAELHRQAEYWLDRFAGEIPVIELPYDFYRPEVQNFAGDRVGFVLEREVQEQLEALAQESLSTLYMVLLAAFNVLLAKYSGQEDIIVGSPVAGRVHPDVENMLGMFVNTLAMRNQPQGGKAFLEFLSEVRENSLQAFSHQDYPFEELVERLSLQRDLSRNPLFDVMFTMQNMDFSGLTLDGVQVYPFANVVKTAKVDLTLYAREGEEGLEFELEYATGLFTEQTIQRMAIHFLQILRQFGQNREMRIRQIEMLTVSEREQILQVFNDTVVEYPDERKVHHFFEEQVACAPERVALYFGDEMLTYGELNARANAVAWMLRGLGVTSDTPVGIMLERSQEMMVGILAILKAGGAYLPIDPKYPEERIEYMLKDSGTELLLVRGSGLKSSEDSMESGAIQFTDNGHSVRIIDLTQESLYRGDRSNLPEIGSSKDMAYIIYTSGTTGRPKGVMIEHHSVVNRICWMQKMYPLGETDVILQKTTYTFDVSVWELFWWFYAGASLTLLVPGGEKEPETIVQTVRRHAVTTMHFVPSMLNVFLDYLERENPWGMEERLTLRQVFASGEALNPSQVNRFNALFTAEVSLINLYGPTEATVDVSYYDCTSNGELKLVPIGKAIDNIQLYVVNQDLQLQPIGVAGELCIAGVGVARGYLKRPELTGEKFVDNPFGGSEKMYRTGDRVRWLADGNIEYLGRTDHQVKIRGYRIEPGEIEYQLMRLPGLRSVCVLLRADGAGENYLTAYYVAEREWTVLELREELGKVLPEYMLPTYFIQLDEMPVTANGKIDRKALPLPEANLRVSSEFIAPRNLLESKLQAIWQEVMGLSRVSIEDNFFELGGHSLKAVAVATAIKREWNVDVSLRELFGRPTIKALAEFISLGVSQAIGAIEPVERREFYPVSSAQKRMYVLHQLEEAGTNYNMPHLLRIEGQLDILQLEQAFQTLLKRHEPLRTSFVMKGGEPVQIVHDVVDFQLAEYSLEHGTQISEFARSKVIKNLVQPFDLAKAPIFKAAIFCGQSEHWLFIDSNHIILDGVSYELLIGELMALYCGVELAEPRVQYKDYVLWQEEVAQQERLKVQESYWLNTFKGKLPELNLPQDYLSGEEDYAGEQLDCVLSEELTAKVKWLFREYSTSEYTILLTVYTILLGRYAEQEDIIVGTSLAGRTHADLEKMVGMFVNTLAIRSFPIKEKRFSDYLQEVRETVFNVADNQDYPFEELINQLGLNWVPGKNPLLRAYFFTPTFAEYTYNSSGLKVTPYPIGTGRSKFDLLLFLAETGSQIKLLFEYKTGLFKRSTIEQMSIDLLRIIEQVTKTPEMLIGEIALNDRFVAAQSMEEDEGDFGF